MSKLPTHTERIESLREELLAYMGLRDRLGTPISYLEAARGHRAQVAENYRADADRMWLDRLSLLDEILDHERGTSQGVAPDGRAV